MFLPILVSLLGASIDAFLLTSPTASQVCYGDLGCFKNTSPWKSSKRPDNYLPESPQVVDTKFLLYTRATPTTDKEEVLTASDPSSITNSHYDASKPTKFIVHGFTHNGHKQWVENMKSELLKSGDMNVISVDWGKGAGLPYGQATANTRLVGAQIAQLINYLIGSTETTADNFHIIGHSLGAHIAGYAGDGVKGLGRISGLDPAEPFYENTPPMVRLDPGDAKYVDVIHTDASTILSLGMGSRQAMGHIDFYPNGGEKQPGCDHNLFSKLTHTVWNAVSLGLYAAEGAVACSHERSYDLYTESINSVCPFTGYPCTGEDEFNKGHCLSCQTNQCAKMGYHSIESTGARGSMYLNTEATSPYCGFHYQVNISAETGMDGVVSIVLHGSKGDTSVISLTSGTEVVNAGNVLSHLVTSNKDIGTITGITVKYDEKSSILTDWMFPDDWKLMGITVREGETQTTTTFCAYGKDVMTHKQSDFKVTGHCS